MGGAEWYGSQHWRMITAWSKKPTADNDFLTCGNAGAGWLLPDCALGGSAHNAQTGAEPEGSWTPWF